MRVLYLYSHPVETSFHAAIRARGLDALAAAGHEVDLLDLYAEDFDPVLRADERRRYHDTDVNQQGLEGYVQRLRSADALVMQFPTWNFGPPAILKGFLDRVLMPGVAFQLADEAAFRPLLTHVRALVGITTYGRPRLHVFWVGDPPRRMVRGYLPWLMASHVRVHYEALYNIDRASHATRSAFLDRVERRLASL